MALTTDQLQIIERLLAVASALVEERAPGAPQEVQNQAALRLIGWMYDSDPAQIRYGANPMLHSGAGSLLGPWARQKLLAPSGAAPAPSPAPTPNLDGVDPWALTVNPGLLVPQEKLPAGDLEGLQLDADGDLVVIPRRGQHQTIPLPHVPTAFVRGLSGLDVDGAGLIQIRYRDSDGNAQVVKLTAANLKTAIDAAHPDASGVQSIDGLSQNSGVLTLTWTDSAGNSQTSSLQPADLVELLQDAGVNPVSTIGDPSGTAKDGLKFTWDNFRGDGRDVQWTPAMLRAALGPYGTGITLEAISSGLRATLGIEGGDDVSSTADWDHLAGFIAQHENINKPPVKLFIASRESAAKYTFRSDDAVALKAAWLKYNFISVHVKSARGSGIMVNTEREVHFVFPTLRSIPFESFGSQVQGWASNQVEALMEDLGNTFCRLTWNSGNPEAFPDSSDMGEIHFGNYTPDGWIRTGDGRGPYAPAVTVWAF